MEVKAIDFAGGGGPREPRRDGFRLVPEDRFPVARLAQDDLHRVDGLPANRDVTAEQGNLLVIALLVARVLAVPDDDGALRLVQGGPGDAADPGQAHCGGDGEGGHVSHVERVLADRDELLLQL